MTQSTEFDVPAGVAEEIDLDLRRILAPNPSPMTYRGTNTYLLGRKSLAVIDPGPEDAAHLAAILNAVKPGQTISHIFVTHAHLDHSPLAKQLADQTGAPVFAYGDHLAGRSRIMRDIAAAGLVGRGEGVDENFSPDMCLSNGEVISGDDWSLTAHWTPGHFGNHMCFAKDDILFAGDLVMGWASSLVSPPDGDLTDFMQSCRNMRELRVSVCHSGHGAPITDPQSRIDWLISHRLSREAAVLGHVSAGPSTADALTRLIYTETPTNLLPAAARNVLAHLIDLNCRGLVRALDPLSECARFERV